jgi:hypothetical protein
MSELQVEEGMDILQSIKEAGLNESQVRELLRKLKGEKVDSRHKLKSDTKHGDCKKVREVTRTYNCAHCGARWTRVISLTPEDVVCGLDKMGKTVLITYAGPYVLDSWVHQCSNCVLYVDKMTTEELKRRYLETLKYVPLPKRID